MSKQILLTRPKNKDVRPREYLTESEVTKLIKAARLSDSYSLRDSTMILVAYTHGLRISELLNLKWSQINFEEGAITINRLKRGRQSIHPLTAIEIRALNRIKKKNKTSYVFITLYNAPMSPSTFQKIILRAGQKADLGFPVHPHMLRHATGYKLVNDGQDIRKIQHYLGHQNIQHTVRYTELDSQQFNGFWD